jgi:signal transduction histidine kinase
LDGAILIGLDAAGIVRFWSAAAERHLGRTAQEAEGQTLAGLPAAGLSEVAAKGEWYGRAALNRADGSKLEASLFLSRASGGISLIAIPGADTREACAIISASAHDLRAPLNTVLGFAELLQSAGSGSLLPAQREFVGEILHGGWLMLRLLTAVDDLARVTLGTLRLGFEAFALDRLLETASETSRVHAQERRIAVELAIDPSIGEVVLDPARMAQIVECTLFDAIDCSLEGGRATLTVEALDPLHFRLAVDSAPRGEPGVRLGLSLARRLVEAQGGEVHSGASLFEAALPKQGKA